MPNGIMTQDTYSAGKRSPTLVSSPPGPRAGGLLSPDDSSSTSTASASSFAGSEDGFPDVLALSSTILAIDIDGQQ